MSKAVIFDLDGTLIDSLGDIHAALNDVLQLRNAPPLALATVCGFIGKGSANLVMRALKAQNLPIDEASCAAALADFLSLYSAGSAKLTTIFDGVIEALDQLRDGGFRLGICTNKPLAPTQIVLDQFGLTRFFDTIVGGDQLGREQVDLVRGRCAVDDEVDHGLQSSARLAAGELLDGTIKRALLDGLERLGQGVEADDGHIQPTSLDRLDGAQGHVVIGGDDGARFRVAA